MCPSEDVTYCRSPPPVSNRVDSLYDNEVESDIVFLVGKEPDVWRLPGHKNILSEANEVFRALLVGPLATRDTTIVIDDVECRAFDYLLKFLYGKDIKFKSVSTALYTLYPAHKYLCTDLIKLCVNYLEQNLTKDNVLEIFTNVRFYTYSNCNLFRCEPSAPPMDTISTASNDLIGYHNGSLRFDSVPDESLRSETKSLIRSGAEEEKPPVECTIQGLVEKCLRVIDQNADFILLQEAIEDMDKDSLKDIVKRDTLKVASEYSVFLALDRWANRECKRRKLVLNARNRRQLLGDLFFEIRFPFLTPDEFIRKPIQSGLLSQHELAVVSALISKTKKLPSISEDWLPHIETMKRRRIHYNSENLALSQKTYLIDLDKNKRELRRSYSFFRKKKNKDGSIENGAKRKSFRSMSIDSCRSDKKCMTRLAEYLLDIFVCLFD